MRNGKRTSRERINEYALESENVQHADAPLPELPPMPNRNTFDGNIPTFQAALIKWFDNRWVIQSYLGIPFDQPVPDFKDSVALRFSQRACRPLRLSRLTTIFRPPSILPPMFWPILRETPPLEVAPTAPRTRGKERAASAHPSVAHPERNDPRANSPCTNRDAEAFPV
ncbi:hypothetical protein Pst134EA_007709 [Puccinia striiformis f. sp. tritici]|uniref:hypothetical protein n=1 Tax=Puccinia striiformis f. sp. tritici TaxID=168172 RepID=UPI002007356C|nr:hypothetical protein Pst134EA_007709 [Puccinia striiformis f. sp. tritici]KAH9470457.1 hypothetical protein Pst134EA_007709 [Puccinia striiformis f. sp. tritici]